MPDIDRASLDPNRRQAHNRELRRLLLFLVVGSLNTAFGYGVFAATWFATGNSVASVVIGNVVGAGFNYLTTGRIVFANRGFKALIPFLLGYLIVLCANLSIVETLKALGCPPLVAGATSLPFLVLLSYSYNRLLVFRTSAQLLPTDEK